MSEFFPRPTARAIASRIDANLADAAAQARRTLRTDSRSASLPRFHPAIADLESRTVYHASEFLHFYDDEFVDVAYRHVLGRLPDREGLDLHRRLLREGRGRAELLLGLRLSGEGKARGVRIVGLWPIALAQRLYRVPIVGRFAAIGAAFVQLPGIVRALESQVALTRREIRSVGDAVNALATEVEARAAVDGVATGSINVGRIDARVRALEDAVDETLDELEIVRAALGKGSPRR